MRRVKILDATGSHITVLMRKRRGYCGDALFKQVLDLLEETSYYGMYVVTADFREFLQEFLLSLVESGWRLRNDPHQLIAASVPVNVRHPLAPETKHLVRLGPGRYLEGDFAVERGHLYPVTERRLDETDRDLAQNVVAGSFKDGMLCNVYDDVQVTSFATHTTRFTFTSDL